MERRDRGSSRPAPLGPLAQADALDTLDPETLVRVRPQRRVMLACRQRRRDHQPRRRQRHLSACACRRAAHRARRTRLDSGRRPSRAERRAEARARRSIDAGRCRRRRPTDANDRLMSPDPAASRLRCSFAADARGDPLAGTAAHARGFLLIESPGAWGQNALSESRLDPEIVSVVAARAAGLSYRVLLIKRPGRVLERRGGRGPSSTRPPVPRR